MSVCNNTSITEFPNDNISIYYLPWMLGFVSFLATVALAVIAFGNIMIGLAIWKTDGLRTTTNAFKICLADFDLMLGAISIASIAFEVPEVMQYVDKRMWAIVITALILLAISDSISSVFLIALYRYLYISHPLRYWDLGPRL